MKLHYKDKTVFTHYIYYDNGNCKSISHLKNGWKFHKENGPSYIEYNNSGFLEVVKYRINDKLHREGGPAVIFYRENGSKIIEYFINDKLHRVYGPASIYEFKDSSKRYVYVWYYKDYNYTKKVNEWLEDNNMNWKEMCENEFDRMWLEIL